MFGDTEPEDAYDRTDPPAMQLVNLRRRARWLWLFRDPPPLDTLEDIAAAVQRARDRRDLDARGTLRADQLDEDIAYLRTVRADG